MQAGWWVSTSTSPDDHCSLFHLIKFKQISQNCQETLSWRAGWSLGSRHERDQRSGAQRAKSLVKQTAEQQPWAAWVGCLCCLWRHCPLSLLSHWNVGPPCKCMNIAWVLLGNSHSQSLPTAQVRKWEQGTAAGGHQHGDRNPMDPPGPPHSATHHSNFSGHTVWVLHYPPKAPFLVCCYILSHFLKYLSLTTAARS